MVTTSPAVLATAFAVGLAAAGLVFADVRRRGGRHPATTAGAVLLLSLTGFPAATIGIEIYAWWTAPARLVIVPREAYVLVSTGGLAVAAATVLGYGLLSRLGPFAT